MTDKAVSTEDLCKEDGYNGVVRLETFLNTLVENKVESLKNENNRKSLSVQSSPKTILNRLRVKSSPSIRDEKRIKNKSEFKQLSMSSTDSQRCQCHYKSLPELAGPSKLVHDDVVCIEQEQTCCCNTPTRKSSNMNYDDDYVSLKIDPYGDDTDRILADEALRQARRKRRRRRKRRMKKRMAMNVVIDQEMNDKYKVINADELPQRARWTIVATACILLFMCLLLVGITLRMAPLIDDMVRKENEELLNSLQSGSSVQNV